MMKALIAVALVAAAGFALAPAADARPLPCGATVDPAHYVYAHCDNIACVVVPLDGERYYCTP